jgi:omega-amidase
MRPEILVTVDETSPPRSVGLHELALGRSRGPAARLAKGDNSRYRAPVNVIGLQFDIAWENKASNYEKVRHLLEQASPEQGALVVLPEMFASGFSMNTAQVAEEYGGQTETFLSRLAQEFGVYVIGGVAARGKDGRARNKALAFAPSGELLGFYAKMRPFSPGGESEHYTAGDRPTALRVGETMVAPFVCYDLRFPELFRQAAASHRPELFAVIANWPEKRVSHWVRLLQARAIENQAFVIGVNRIGVDPFYAYPGRSLIVDYNGDLLADGGANEGIVRATLDLKSLGNYRKGLPFLADLRL